MIVYNVTFNIEDSIRDEFLQWMKTSHIPSVMATGLFLEHKFLKLISNHGDSVGTSTYAVQYYLKDLKDFLKYSDHFSPRFQQETIDKYGNQVIAFSTLLEEIK